MLQAGDSPILPTVYLPPEAHWCAVHLPPVMYDASSSICASVSDSPLSMEYARDMVRLAVSIERRLFAQGKRFASECIPVLHEEIQTAIRMARRNDVVIDETKLFMPFPSKITWII